jgi:hypothetical protein
LWPPSWLRGTPLILSLAQSLPTSDQLTSCSAASLVWESEHLSILLNVNLAIAFSSPSKILTSFPAAVHVVNLYFEEEHAKEREHIVKLANATDAASTELLRGYAREGMRKCSSSRMPYMFNLCYNHRFEASIYWPLERSRGGRRDSPGIWKTTDQSQSRRSRSGQL